MTYKCSLMLLVVRGGGGTGCHVRGVPGIAAAVTCC
jgi:hypothetical protein